MKQVPIRGDLRLFTVWNRCHSLVGDPDFHLLSACTPTAVAYLILPRPYSCSPHSSLLLSTLADLLTDICVSYGVTFWKLDMDICAELEFK